MLVRNPDLTRLTRDAKLCSDLSNLAHSSFDDLMARAFGEREWDETSISIRSAPQDPSRKPTWSVSRAFVDACRLTFPALEGVGFDMARRRCA